MPRLSQYSDLVVSVGVPKTSPGPVLLLGKPLQYDRFLPDPAATHGLTDPVNRYAILEALEIPDVANSTVRLIELALHGGGPDNVTVVVEARRSAGVAACGAPSPGN
jgi:hypothetical protein